MRKTASWPPKNSEEQAQFMKEYNLCPETLESFKDSPIDKLSEFSRNRILVLIVAGDSDTLVPYDENGKIMVDYYKLKGLDIVVYLKAGCGHHSHSLDDVTPIINFINK